MASSPQFNMSLLQAYHLGKCLKYCGKKCWEWTIQEERTHRKREEYERERERILEQMMIYNKWERWEQEKIRKEKEAKRISEEEEEADKEDVLKILENINIDEIIKEFQIKNNN